MSYTTILCLKPGNKSKDAVEDLIELRNSHGYAPVIWKVLCEKYYGTKNSSYMFDGTIDRLWPRYKDLGIPEFERALLMMTYDRAYISKENYQRAAKDIRLWLQEHVPNPEYINHWEKIAEIFESNPDCEAIGFHCTSVSENPFLGGFDEEKEEYLPIDWETTFEIYKELDSLK